jgi:hypothetical protein
VEAFRHDSLELWTDSVSSDDVDPSPSNLAERIEQTVACGDNGHFAKRGLSAYLRLLVEGREGPRRCVGGGGTGSAAATPCRPPSVSLGVVSV